MRRIQIITALLALAGFMPACAQYTFTFSVSWSGNCSGYTAQMNQAIRGFQTQTINGFPTRELCEQTRAMCHQELGHIELIYFDAKTGKEIKREATNCKLNVSTTPCTGRPMAGSVGTLNALGVSQGTSFYSSNTADEIQNWSNDDMDRILALDANRVVEQEQYAPIADSKYKRAIIEENGKMYFRSLNIDEHGGMLTSSPDLDMFEPVWQMEKKTRNLPDDDVFAYKDRMHNEAAMQLEDLLKKSNLTKEQLEGKIWEWDYLLNNYKLQENKNYSEEKEILAKAQLLAKYKVDYKAILNLKYIDSADENQHETEAAFVLVNGKTREQYYQEELEKKEKLLIENGISLDDIKIVKSQTEKEALIKDHVSTAVDIADGVGHVNEMVFAEGDKRHDVIKDILSGVSEGATLGVMVNNLITIESYNIVADAISKEIQGLEDRHKTSEDYYKEQRDKIQSISDIVKASSEDERKRTANMNRNESLKWSMGIDNSINKIKGRSRQDYYGAFPDIRKNEIIGREHVTIFRSNL